MLVPFFVLFLINNNMNFNNKILFKILFYFLVTSGITFITLLDTIDVHAVDKITWLEWVKMLLKSFLPSLLTVKAFLDPTVNSVMESKLAEIPSLSGEK